MQFQVRRWLYGSIALVLLATLITWPVDSLNAQPQGSGITFTDIAANDGAGISYRRAPSASEVLFQQIKDASIDEPIPLQNFALVPMKSRGIPGVAGRRSQPAI